MNNEHGKSTAFWLELILSLTALAVCGCICLFVFARADLESKQSWAETQAMLSLQSTAEAFKADPKGWLSSGGESSLFYDSEWKPLPSAEGAAYQMLVQVSMEDGLYQAELHLEAAAAVPGFQGCSLSVKKYIPERGNAS